MSLFFFWNFFPLFSEKKIFLIRKIDIALPEIYLFQGNHLVYSESQKVKRRIFRNATIHFSPMTFLRWLFELLYHDSFRGGNTVQLTLCHIRNNVFYVSCSLLYACVKLCGITNNILYWFCLVSFLSGCFVLIFLFYFPIVCFGVLFVFVSWCNYIVLDLHNFGYNKSYDTLEKLLLEWDLLLESDVHVSKEVFQKTQTSLENVIYCPEINCLILEFLYDSFLDIRRVSIPNPSFVDLYVWEVRLRPYRCRRCRNCCDAISRRNFLVPVQDFIRDASKIWSKKELQTLISSAYLNRNVSLAKGMLLYLLKQLRNNE